MSDLSIGLIGPLPPPSGGMANPTRQLARLLASDGLDVEVVQGKTALLVSPGDEAGMAEAIVSILADHDLASKLISAGLEEVQQYTWPSVRKRLLETYRGVSTNAATNSGEQDVT